MQGPSRKELKAKVDELATGWCDQRDQLHAMQDFPADVWRELANSSLLGLGLSKSSGGMGGDYKTLAIAARRLSQAGAVMGITTTWLAHNINARLHIEGRGTVAQREEWLPRLASGATSVCVAISEPGAGAHPKHLTTAAVRDGDDFVINGAKSYLTNGPLSELFIILAITDEVGGRKSFSAILVPRSTPGLQQTPGIEIDFLRPSPHCGLELKDCRVPVSNLLGSLGEGFSEISMPMRAVEDVLKTSSLAGALSAELRFVADAAQAQPVNDALADFGSLRDRADALGELAFGLAAELDRDTSKPERLNAAAAGFRAFTKYLQDDIDTYVAGHDLVLSQSAQMLRRDIVKSFEIAASAHRIQSARRAEAFFREGAAH